MVGARSIVIQITGYVDEDGTFTETGREYVSNDPWIDGYTCGVLDGAAGARPKDD